MVEEPVLKEIEVTLVLLADLTVEPRVNRVTKDTEVCWYLVFAPHIFALSVLYASNPHFNC